MNKRLKDLLLLIFSPIILAIGFLTVGSYKLLFGWWLDKRLATKNQERFAEDIRDHLSILFRHHAAQIVPNEDIRFPPRFDTAFVMVVVGNLRFRFARGLGELHVHIAPQHAPRDWQEVATVLAAIEEPPGFQRTATYAYYRLQDFARLLLPNLARLQKAFSEEQFAVTKEKLSPIHDRNRRDIRRLNAEINNR